MQTNLLDILQNHIRMPIKRLYPRQQLLVVSQTDQYLRLISDGLLEDREWTLGDFVFFQFTDLRFVQFGPWDVGVLTVNVLAFGPLLFYP